MPPEKQRFVILEHQAPDGLHWDVMIQFGDALWTWRASRVPDASTASLPLEKIADHPLRFLSYEGPVQNRTAAVRQIDGGICAVDGQTSDGFTAVFEGTRLRGAFCFKKQTDTAWTMQR